LDASRDADRKMLVEMPKEKLVALHLVQMRNLWAVDGLYFLGIEEKFGTQSATSIDARVWEVMGKLEARSLRETLGVSGKTIPELMKALSLSSWSLDLEHKAIEVEEKHAVFRNKKCRVQLTRLEKGLPEFPCKQVRLGYLRSFVRELNPEMEVRCVMCPPDDHPDDVWCEWEFCDRPGGD